MKRKFLILIAATLTSILAFTTPAIVGAQSGLATPNIDSGTPFYLAYNTNECMKANGVDKQLTINSISNGCSNWTETIIPGTGISVITDGAGNCMRENDSSQITVVNNCSLSQQQVQSIEFVLDSCGSHCYKLYNVGYGNYVSTTGGSGGDKVWGGYAPPNHLDWNQYQY